MAASHPSSTGESHDRIQAAYDATRAELAALGNDQLLAVNVQVVHAVTTVLGALPALRALRPQIARHLPTFDLERFDKLQQYGLALLYAHAAHRARPEVPDGIAELGQEVKQLRDRLFLNAECLAQHGLLDGRPLQGCKRGRSHRALAGDVFTLVALFTASWDQLRQRTPVSRELLQHSQTRAYQLLRALGERRAPAAAAETQLLRQRAFTLLAVAYADARRAVEYLRHEQRDASVVAPSFHVGRAGRARGRAGRPQPADVALEAVEGLGTEQANQRTSGLEGSARVRTGASRRPQRRRSGRTAHWRRMRSRAAWLGGLALTAGCLGAATRGAALYEAPAAPLPLTEVATLTGHVAVTRDQAQLDACGKGSGGDAPTGS